MCAQCCICPNKLCVYNVYTEYVSAWESDFFFLEAQNWAAQNF